MRWLDLRVHCMYRSAALMLSRTLPPEHTDADVMRSTKIALHGKETKKAAPHPHTHPAGLIWFSCCRLTISCSRVFLLLVLILVLVHVPVLVLALALALAPAPALALTPTLALALTLAPVATLALLLV